ncbi:hypothetical protein VD0002_g142 [Verticillium dahliae]|uniref:3-oxoacyl-[acyl-carrier-protein] reductase n=3 Tax=Verticillium TaxID=1036719 RepID=G2WTR7_VERDV|nr:3-oxoacyl-[acyl-carrier-protein] reductase [Verticillium dahliae VdLs.17]KAH6691027.1 3-oxoacyl-reductase [Verticillium dahliae]EGY17508.1 3-oxoacyl-[acyl-carrier-protein] reductase [Verticillium dahliae VdLs.17]PNH35410.1 hypothetical protein BJF96_g1204 [Verticillium dahliae]PNH48446.1 hypothetical protein VD0004_g74 [Verticillium dahliae]PNH57425.1 hypothetical protein VD0003_g419 [Verticillium dahliae]
MTTLLRGAAFITGAASGIGQYTALAFAKHGMTHLALADINGPLLAKANAALQAQHPALEILSLDLDVQKPEQVDRGIAETVRRFRRLDVAVNNAGIGGSGRATHELDEAEFARVLDVDLHGVWRCQRAELRAMLAQDDLGPRRGRGRIVNVASMYGLVAPAHHLAHTAYTAAKHGVLGLTRADANTYGPRGIRVNAICPGYVETPLVQKAMSAAADSPLANDIARTPLQRIMQMEEVADCIAFLASDMSSAMQGAALVADGGFTIQ